MGSGPFINTSRGRGRDGVIAVLFNQNWKRDHVLLYALPKKGEGHRDHTPVLATAAVSHYIEFTSLESLDKFRSELQVCSLQVS